MRGVERYLLPNSSATPAAVARAGVVDKDTGHLSGGHGQQVCTIFDGERTGGEARIGLMHQGGGRQGMVLPSPAHIRGRQPAEIRYTSPASASPPARSAPLQRCSRTCVGETL